LQALEVWTDWQSSSYVALFLPGFTPLMKQERVRGLLRRAGREDVVRAFDRLD
jgi:hypothetical protein